MIKTVEVRGLTPEDFEHRGQCRTVAVTVDGILLAAGVVDVAMFVEGGVRFTLGPFDRPVRHPPMAYLDPYEPVIELEDPGHEHSKR